MFICIFFPQVPLPSIGAEDIVDGNHRLILGLIWTIKHGSPTKIEDTQEISSTEPPQVERTTGLQELIEPINQDSFQVQQKTTPVIVEREASNVLDDDKYLERTTCILQVKPDADNVNDVDDDEDHQNTIPNNLIEADDISVQPKQQDTDKEIETIYKDVMKEKQHEDEKPDVIYHSQCDTTQICLKYPKQQKAEEINEAGELNNEQLIEKENVDVVKVIEYQNLSEKASELNSVQHEKQEQKETELVLEYKNEELELEHSRMEDFDGAQLSEKENQNLNGGPNVEEIEMKEEGDSSKLQSSLFDKKQGDESNSEMELLRCIKEEEVDDLHGNLSEHWQEPGHQTSIKLGHSIKEEEGELNKLLFSELKHQKYHEDGESEIPQKDIEIYDESIKIPQRSQQDNSIEKTTPENPQEDSDEDSEYDPDKDAQTGTTSTPFLQELRQECNRRGLIERQQEAKEKEEKEKRDIEFYKLLEQVSRDHYPVEPENEEMRKNIDHEKYQKEKLWKQREVERLQEEADRRHEEAERQALLKYEQEEEQRQQQLLIDN